MARHESKAAPMFPVSSSRRLVSNGKWYEDYLHSEHWQRTKIKRLLRANINEAMELIQCEHADCGMFVPLLVLNVHHLTYKRLGHERMEDLQVLCRSCHRVVHGQSPERWWEVAKAGGRRMIFSQSIYLDRKIKRMGDIMVECLSYCEERQGMALLRAGKQQEFSEDVL
jgi:hypothetical protein